jgi:broad specificity phosphatase PhoE
MRHLQKGAGEDPPLSAEGAANTQRLVSFFKADPPRAIFVSTARRARETAAPLAAALGITATPYDPRDSAALASAVAAASGTILIVGHSNTVPEVIQRLGGTAPAPLADSDYGDIWKISGPERTVTKLRLGGN